MQARISKAETFINERDSSERLTVHYTNWGEPYAEGVRFDLEIGDKFATVDLERREVKRLHDLLGRLLADMR